MLFLSGVFIDFITVGVFKINWLWIYAAIYLGIAGTLYNRLLGSALVKPILAAFLSGAIVGHLALMKWSSTRNYQMKVINPDPITLQSADFSEHLLLSSSELQAFLAQQKQDVLPVSIYVEKSYGCITSFKIITVAGINLDADPKASWVWRATGDSSAPTLADENRRLFWCGIHWF